MQKSNLKIDYLNRSPEQLNELEKFDVILNLEIVEHVEDVNLYIQSCQKLLKRVELCLLLHLIELLLLTCKAIIGAEYFIKMACRSEHMTGINL